jgi:tetratricopeptide (TPR) repeat protein
MKVFLLLLSIFLPANAAFSADPIHSNTAFDHSVAQANALFLDAKFDEGLSVFQKLEKSDPNNPAVSYFLANGYWWKIFREFIYDKDAKETEFDDDFEKYLERTMDQSEELIDRNKYDILGLFYLGNAYSLRSRVKGLRGSYFSAGRDAAKGKNYLEQVLKFQPNQYDAYYNIGVYNYLAGALPGYAKVLKVFLFLPGGSKEKGLNYLNIASKKSPYFSAEAQLILARFYADYEERPQEAADIVDQFHQKYPENAWYHYWLGTLYSDEINDYDRAEKIYREILLRCDQKMLSYTDELQSQAMLKLARVRTKQFYPEESIDITKKLIALKPKHPSWILARAYMELGNTYDLIGMRKEALDAYNHVLSLPNYRNLHDEAKKLRSEEYDQTQASIYRLNLEGRRLTGEGKYTEAENSFNLVSKHFPNNDQTNFCIADLYLHKGDYKKAQTILQTLEKKMPKEPKWLGGAIFVRLGNVYQAQKQNDAAKRAYAKALDTKFIASDDRNAAKRAIRQMEQNQ